MNCVMNAFPASLCNVHCSSCSTCGSSVGGVTFISPAKQLADTAWLMQGSKLISDDRNGAFVYQAKGPVGRAGLWRASFCSSSECCATESLNQQDASAIYMDMSPQLTFCDGRLILPARSLFRMLPVSSYACVPSEISEMSEGLCTSATTPIQFYIVPSKQSQSSSRQ